MKTECAVRRAQKKYRCVGALYRACNAAIHPGDVYFVFTIHSPNGHRTRRYCIECAHQDHPDQLKQSMATIKSAGKRKAAARRVGPMAFVSAKSRSMKRKPTMPEQFFWEQLKSSGIKIKFLQQQILHGYIVDFWAPNVQLAVELDGVQHLGRKTQDANRDEVLKSHGITVLRFPARLVYSDLKFVFERIQEVIEKKKNTLRNGKI